MAGEPRRTEEPSWTRRLAAELRALRRDVERLQRGASLRNASISGGDGLKVYSPSGFLRISLNTADGAVVGYDEAGAPAVRMGELAGSSPGAYGVEVLVGGTWVQLGVQSTTWDQVAGRPGTPGGATLPGSSINSAVAEAVHAGQADGSQYGWTNPVGGTEFYALWVGNDGGYRFGRNTSSIKYKTNVRDAVLDPKAVLKLRPVVYDRKPTTETLPDGVEGPARQFPGARDELGLIAEESATLIPKAITRFQGEVDGIRYELLPVYMLPLLAEQEARISKLEAAVRQLGGNI